MKEAIENYKKQLNDAKAENGDWRTPYENLMRELYNLPVLFFALSKDNNNEANKESLPRIPLRND